MSAAAFAAPVMMSADWAKEACAARNKDPVLTDKLAESGWVRNDGGKGEYGTMRAMMFGRLEFEGPKGEAMSNMTPFENFQLGKVPSDTGSCPK